MARIGGTGPVYGTSDKTYGIFESHDKATSVEEIELQRGDGEIYAVEQTAKREAYTFEYTYVTSGGPDEDDVGSGTAIDMPETGETAYIKTITGRRQKGNFRVVSGEATDWPYLNALAS